MKTTHQVIAVIIFGLMLGLTTQGLAAMASIRGIGFAAQIEGISADGTVIVGMYDHPAKAFYWSDATGMVEIPGMDSCKAVSGDGSVVVGADGLPAAYWSAASGLVQLPLLHPEAFGYGEAQDVSWDGTAIVGFDTSAGYVAPWRWTADTGVVGLGSLAGGSDAGVAYGISGDGSVIVGYSKSDIGNEAFRWTEQTGMVGLGVVEGRSSSTAWGISADGSTVVGQSGYEAFRWTEETGMIGLGVLGGIVDQTMAVDVSGDGSIVIGNSWYEGAFIWDQVHGMRLLGDALFDDYGLDLAGWDLGWVYGISDDGLTMVGGGVNPDGLNETWIVTIPEPLTVVFLSAGCLLLRRSKRR